jgi:hypothetical protein
LSDLAALHNAALEHHLIWHPGYGELTLADLCARTLFPALPDISECCAMCPVARCTC